MDEVQGKLLERLILLKRQIKKMYPELSQRLTEGPLMVDQEEKKDRMPHENPD